MFEKAMNIIPLRTTYMAHIHRESCFNRQWSVWGRGMESFGIPSGYSSLWKIAHWYSSMIYMFVFLKAGFLPSTVSPKKTPVEVASSASSASSGKIPRRDIGTWWSWKRWPCALGSAGNQWAVCGYTMAIGVISQQTWKLRYHRFNYYKIYR